MNWPLVIDSAAFAALLLSVATVTLFAVHGVALAVAALWRKARR